MIHFLINGFPYYFSDTATALTGATATLKPWIVDADALIRSIRHDVDAWGGVVKGGQISVTISDADLALSRVLPLAPDLRPVRCLEYQILPVLSGEVQVDVSDNSELSVGDILQTPYDAWEITAVGPAELPTGINADRGIYSCFPGSTWIFQPYLQRGSGQNELFSFGRDGKVPEIDGRVCTLWIDGALAWIGVISPPRQQGPRWTFSARHILDAWSDKFSADALPSFALNHDAYNGGGKWWQGNLVPGDSSGVLPAIGATSAPYYPQDYGWTTEDRRGLSYLGTGEPTMVQTVLNRGTLAALGEQAYYDSSLGKYVTKPGGTPIYGWIDDPSMEVGINGDLTNNLIGEWLVCPDGLAGTVRKQIADVDAVNGTITLEQMTYDENGDYVLGCGGYSSNAPILFRAGAIVSARSLPVLVYALLTSTGSGYNGDHDLLPGYLGLGLPAELLDDRISDLFYNTKIINGDLSDVNLDDELQAAGIWLMWRNGQFAIREVKTPSALSVTAGDLDGDLIAAAPAPEVDRASVAPVLSVTYQTARGDKLTINTRPPQIFRPTAGNSKDLKSELRPDLPGGDQIAALSSLSLWLSRYAPAIPLDLIPGHQLELGDVVRLSSAFIAGTGDCYGTAVPALVIGVSPVTCNLLINTQPVGGRVLCPALRVLSWDGAVLTVAGGALEWLELAGLDDDLLLHNETDGACQLVKLVSVADDLTVTVSAAPIHTSGDAVVLTLPPWDAAVGNPDARAIYCWLADVDGQLDGDESDHVYLP